MKFSEYRRRAPNRTALAVFFWWILVRTVVRVGMRLLYRQRCVGYEHIPVEGPVIYASNHQSHYDPPIVGCLTGPFASLARSGLFAFKPFGWLIRSLGAISIEQGKGDTAAVRAALGELRTGGRMLIYPEGSRTPDGAIHAFEPGVMLLVRRSRASVVPVAIEGAFDVWPIGRKRPRLRGRLAVRAGPAISADELLALPTAEALELLRRRIDEMRLALRADLRRRTGGRYPAPGPGDAG